MYFCPRTRALPQVSVSRCASGKAQRNTWIRTISLSDLLIGCETRRDLLRQQKNQNQLPDVSSLFTDIRPRLPLVPQTGVSDGWRGLEQEIFGDINDGLRGNGPRGEKGV